MESLVLHQELSENHFWLFSLLHYHQLGKNNNKVAGYKHVLDAAPLHMLQFHQNGIMSTVWGLGGRGKVLSAQVESSCDPQTTKTKTT